MPDYLTLDGEPFDVMAPEGGNKPPDLTGEFGYGFDNTLSTSEDGDEEKRIWRFTTPTYQYDRFQALLAVLNTTADEVLAGGYAITRELPELPEDPEDPPPPPVTVPVLPRLGEIVHDPTSTVDFGYMVSFTLHEI